MWPASWPSIPIPYQDLTSRRAEWWWKKPANTIALGISWQQSWRGCHWESTSPSHSQRTQDIRRSGDLEIRDREFRIFLAQYLDALAPIY